jgi:hypothetical protein
MHSLPCTLCYALFAMHSLRCTLCYALFAMHSLLCTLCYSLNCNHCCGNHCDENHCGGNRCRGLMSHDRRRVPRRDAPRPHVALLASSASNETQGFFFSRHINLCSSKQFYAILGKSAATSEILAHRVNATRRALMSHYWTQRTTTCRNAKQHAATQRDATQRDASSLGKSRQLLGVRRAFGGTFGRRGLMSHTSRHIYACRPHPPKISEHRVNSIENK